jgi:predicted P-loop ATPase
VVDKKNSVVVQMGVKGGSKPNAKDWISRITRTSTMKPESTTHNAILVLENDEHLSALFSLDEFSNVVRLLREPCWEGAERDEFTDQDGTELAAWLGDPMRYRLNLKKELVMDCAEALARRRKHHPVREYLNGLKWDKKDRIGSLFPRLFGAADSDYTHHAARCWLVSAVARILWVDHVVRHNGAQVDFMLVLEGEQGHGKTSAVRELFGAQWYAEAMESPCGKDFYQSLRGRWCVEIGEMDSFSKADVTKVKQAITSRFDTYRPSYGRVSRSFRRECVFVGTTNENEYLRDATGARRFLPVKVGRVDILGIVAERDQLWAEAVQLFNDGFAWWELPAAAVDEQEARYMGDAWEDVIGKWLRGEYDPSAYPKDLTYMPTSCGVRDCEIHEVLRYALGLDASRWDVSAQKRAGHALRRLGWERRRGMTGGKRRYVWCPKVPF